MTIHFICRGNVLRSIIAEAYLKSLKLPGITAISSGTVADEFRASNIEQGYVANAQKLLAHHGLAEYAKAEPQQLTQDRLTHDQLVVCMNPVVFEGATTPFTLPPDTVYWNIVDIGEGTRIVDSDAGREEFEEEIFQEVTAKVDELVKPL